MSTITNDHGFYHAGDGSKENPFVFFQPPRHFVDKCHFCDNYHETFPSDHMCWPCLVGLARVWDAAGNIPLHQIAPYIEELKQENANLKSCVNQEVDRPQTHRPRWAVPGTLP